MANSLAPFGARLLDQEGKQFVVRRYPKKSGNAIAEGDFVIQDASGAVDLAAAGGAILGVAVEYKSATDTSSIAVIDDPAATFEIQTGGTVAAADVFQNANIAVGTQNASLKRSGASLDSTTMATTATLQLKILGLSNEYGNAFGQYAKLIVKINNHVLKGGTGSAGV